MCKRGLLLAAAGLLALAGCGFEGLRDDDAERYKVRSWVRDELEVVQAERARNDRAYLEQRIKQVMEASGGPDLKIDAVEARIGRIETTVQTLSRREGFSGGASSTQGSIAAEELDQVRQAVSAVRQAVSDLMDERGVRDAAINARFERVELRTMALPWPQHDRFEGLHLASYKSHTAALRGWEVLKERHASALATMEPLLVEVSTVAGPFVRVMVGAGEPKAKLIELRDRVRQKGDYAMIMPIGEVPARSDDEPHFGPAPGS